LPQVNADVLQRPPSLISLPTLRWALPCPLRDLAICVPSMPPIALLLTERNEGGPRNAGDDQDRPAFEPGDPDPCNDLPEKPMGMH